MTSSSPCSPATSSTTPPPTSPSRPSTPSPATTSARPATQAVPQATPTVPTPVSPIPVASSSAQDSSPFAIPPPSPVSQEVHLINPEKVKAVEKSYLILSTSLLDVKRPLVKRPVEKRSSATKTKFPAKFSKQPASDFNKRRDRMSTVSPSKRKANDVQEPTDEEQWEDVEEETKPEVKAKGKGKKVKAEPGSDDEKPAKRQRAAGGGRKWTGPELEALLSLALQGGPPQSAFNDGIPGRTAQQCSMTWRNTVLPYLKKCLHERGQNGAGKAVKDE